LRAAIDALVHDQGLRQTLAMRARRRALGLSPARMAGGYLDLYDRLLSGRSAARSAARSAEVPTCAS
jgi:hypothetical protein